MCFEHCLKVLSMAQTSACVYLLPFVLRLLPWKPGLCSQSVLCSNRPSFLQKRHRNPCMQSLSCMRSPQTLPCLPERDSFWTPQRLRGGGCLEGGDLFCSQMESKFAPMKVLQRLWPTMWSIIKPEVSEHPNPWPPLWNSNHHIYCALL